MVTNVLLVRHGESEWNALGRWQGQADIPLTELGRRQAAVAATKVGSVDAIVASDLIRARTTAEIIAAHLGIEPVLVDEGLRERDAGEWSGMTRAEIHERYPGALPDDPSRNGSDPGHVVHPPGWERDEDIATRVVAALDRVAAHCPGGTILGVSHGGAINALEVSLTGTRFVRLPNLGGVHFHRDDHGWRAGERILLLDEHDVAVTIPREI